MEAAVSQGGRTMFGMDAAVSYETRWALAFGLTAGGAFLIAMILGLSLLT